MGQEALAAVGDNMIYIWVRATTDWEDEHVFLAQVRPEFRPAVEVWNETFNIPFHIFRHKVRQIAQVNLSRIERSVCADWPDIPDGALVVPVDDDDWFTPDIGKVLEREHDSRAVGYYWTSSFVEVPVSLGHKLYLTRRGFLPRTRPKWICTTNNYALVKSPETRVLLSSHTRASEWLKKQECGSVKKIDQRLSAMNRTLASRSSLAHRGRAVTRSQLIRKFYKYKTLYRRRTAPELAWCRPYLAMMSDLMDQLRIRDPDQIAEGWTRTPRSGTAS